MGQPGPALDPAPVASWPILGGTGRPNFKFVRGLDDRPIQLLDIG
jgi:hypothetical protein